MQSRTIGIVLALALIVSAILAGGQPLAAQSGDETGPSVFLPMMEAEIVPGLEPSSSYVSPDEAGQDSANSTPIHLPHGTYSPADPCAADVFGGIYTFGLQVEAPLLDGIYTNGDLSVELTESGENSMFAWLFFDWRLITIGPGQSVGAVVVQTGRGASAFEYDPPYPLEDSGLHAPGFWHKERFFNRQIRKVTFCLVEEETGPAIEIKKFTLDEKEGLEAAVWNDANTMEEAAQIESQIIWRYVIRRIGSADLTDVSVIDVPEPGKGPADFDVLEFGACVLVASDNIAEWDDPDYGYDYDAFNPPLYGLERFGVETIPDDLVQPGEQVNLTEDFPVLVCDVYGNSLVTNLNIGPITPGGSDVLLDTYYNEATATAFLGQTSNTASDTDISHFIGINCPAFPELCGLPPTPPEP